MLCGPHPKERYKYQRFAGTRRGGHCPPDCADKRDVIECAARHAGLLRQRKHMALARHSNLAGEQCSPLLAPANLPELQTAASSLLSCQGLGYSETSLKAESYASSSASSPTSASNSDKASLTGAGVAISTPAMRKSSIGVLEQPPDKNDR